MNECPGATVNENFALRVVLNSNNLAIYTPHRLSRVLLRCVVAVGARRAVGYTSVHSDRGPRAWGSGACARAQYLCARVVLNSSSFVNSSRSFVMSITPTTSRRDEDELIADCAAPERPDSMAMGRRGCCAWCCGSSLGAAANRSVIGFVLFVIGYVS